jgi:hypothetical protein
MGRRGYPPQFRRKVLDLAEAGRSPTSPGTWRSASGRSTPCRQDRIDGGLHLLTSSEQAELAKAKRRIAELETELRAMRRAMELVPDVVPPRGSSRRSR